MATIIDIIEIQSLKSMFILRIILKPRLTGLWRKARDSNPRAFMAPFDFKSSALNRTLPAFRIEIAEKSAIFI